MYQVNYMLKILKRGLQNPRFYIEALNIKWKYLIGLSFFVSLIMGINVTREMSPILEDIQSNITDAVQFIPVFSIEDEKLILAEENSAVYYQSEFFQLVIDDQIKGNFSQAGISLNEKAASRVSTEPWVNLIIGQEDAGLAIRGNQQIITLDLSVIQSSENLSQIILTLSQYNLISYGILFLAGVLSAFITYWYIIFLTGLFSAILNARLNLPLPLSARIKLSIVASFVPILMIELVKFLIPGFYVSYYILIFATILILYMTFKNHTYFMHDLMNIMRKQDVDIIEDEEKNEISFKLKNPSKKKNKENQNDTKSTKDNQNKENNDDQRNKPS